MSVIDATAMERCDHAASRTVIHDALDRTLSSRVQALALDPPEHLVRALGSIPDSEIGRAVWCHHASRLEHLIDVGHLKAQDLRPLDRFRHQVHVAQHIDPTTLNLSGPDDRER